MTRMPALLARASLLVGAILAWAIDPGRAETVDFFNASQSTNITAWTDTSDTIRTEGYLFTVSRDKLFTGGIGLTNPIGRSIRVPWPAGMEAQAVTAGTNPGGAKIVIKRQDGALFAIQSFTARLLANTAGAGAAIEIMPLLDGEDGRPDPFMYNATGYAGSQFTYSAPELAGFDEYKITLYVDFALMALCAVDASPPRPVLEVSRGSAETIQLAWPTNSSGYVLEAATNLPAQSWTVITNMPGVLDESFVLNLPASNNARFYRLRR